MCVWAFFNIPDSFTRCLFHLNVFFLFEQTLNVRFSVATDTAALKCILCWNSSTSQWFDNGKTHTHTCDHFIGIGCVQNIVTTFYINGSAILQWATASGALFKSEFFEFEHIFFEFFKNYCAWKIALHVKLDILLVWVGAFVLNGLAENHGFLALS